MPITPINGSILHADEQSLSDIYCSSSVLPDGRSSVVAGEIAPPVSDGPGGAAELLGVKPTTLRWRMDQLGIRYRRRDQGTN
jgi:hypothetical protein